MGRREFPLLSLCLILPLSGCQTARAPERGSVSVEIEASPEWRSRAAAADIKRLEDIEAAWREALQDARRAGFGRQVDAEGKLLQPEAALPRPAPTPGSYMCRVIKLGSTTGRTRAFQAFRPFFCHVGVEGRLLSITKQTGSERPGGYIWEDERSDRLVFIGSMALGTEEMPLPYGEDPSRDMVGVFERVAPFRFRLVVPWPRGTSKVDVFELIPAAAQRDS